jgi:hypothetical protein
LGEGGLGLGGFDEYIAAGLATADELRPYIIYWIQVIADHHYRRICGSLFYDQHYTYIVKAGYTGVCQLFERYGYKVLPSPYRADDFKWADSARSPHISSQTSPTHSASPCRASTLQKALSLSKAAYLVYEDWSYVKDIVRQLWKIDNPRDLVTIDDIENSTQAFCFRQDRTIVIAFRGTQQLQDWLTNLQIQLVAFIQPPPFACSQAIPRVMAGSKIHEGFYRAWASRKVRGRIVRCLADWLQERPDSKVYVTGHSLGGALASVAAASLHYAGLSPELVCTFGEPRVFNRILAFQFDRGLKPKMLRFVNNDDIVPEVPLPIRYQHVGQLEYFDWLGNLIAKPGLWLHLREWILGIIFGLFQPGFEGIKDHSMELYIKHLQANLQRQQQDQALEHLAAPMQASPPSEPETAAPHD